MKSFRSRCAALAAATALAGAAAVTLGAPASATTTPASAITNDPNADKGTLIFYGSSGQVVTSGNAASLAHMFDYAAASSAGQAGATKATLFYAFPDHTQADSQNWVSQQQSASTNFPVTSSTAPANIKALTNPVATAASSYANMNDASAGVVKDTTTGYAGIVQIRLYDTGPGVSQTTDFWATDVYYDTNGWQQVFPATAQTTTTALSASPAGHAAPGSPVTITATVTPTAAAGSVGFLVDGTSTGSSVAVNNGVATLTTSTLATGSHTVTANFTPTNSNAYTTSTSAPLSYVVASAPNAPTTVTATPGHGSAVVRWAAPASTNGSPVTSYAVQFSGNGGAQYFPAGTTTTTSKTVTGLINGRSYLFEVAASNVAGTGAYSTPSTAVTPFADATTLSISPSTTIAFGRATSVTGRLVDTTTHTAVAGAPVTIYYRHSPTAAFIKGSTVNTGAAGYAAFTAKPASRTYYQLRYAASAVHAAATSAIQTVSVAQVVAIHATPARQTHGKQFTVWGQVTPSVAGQVVTLQRKFGAAYRNVGTAKLARQKLPNGAFALGYVFRIVQTAKGTYTYRTTRSATPMLAAGVSAPVAVRVV